MLHLTHYEPESPEIPDLLRQLDELHETEKGVLGISPRATGQRRPRS